MSQNLKALTRLIEIETGSEWRVERRTRGKDMLSTDPTKPLQTWIIILANAAGHKQFVPEVRIWELFRPKELAVKVAAVEAKEADQSV